MVGGEIPDWSDAAPVTASEALGDLLARSASGLAPKARVLVAGPAAVALRHRLPRGLAVHLLARGIPDARALATDAGQSVSHAPDTTVIAGALDRVRGRDETFDLVIALGGPEATLAPDSPTMGGPAWLRLVSDLVAPGGRFVASVTNPAGMDHLIGVDTCDVDGWAALADAAPRALTLDDVRGVTGGHVLAAYPSISSPAVVLTESEARSGLGPSQRAVRALSARFDGELALRSPWRTAEQLFSAGLGLALAPAWILVSETVADSALPKVPAGARLVESVLRDAVGSRSHRRTREIVTAYAVWLGEFSGSGPSSDLRDVLMLADGRITPLDTEMLPHVPDGHGALHDGLAAFAQRVCAEGVATLWEAPTPEMVLQDLLSMAGHESALSRDAADRAPLVAPASREGELVRVRDAEAALDETRRQVTWLEGTLRAKDRRIRTLERAIALESSTAYKVVHQLGRPVPAVKRRAREFLQRHGRG